MHGCLIDQTVNNWLDLNLVHWIGPCNSPTTKSMDWLGSSIETLSFFYNSHHGLLGPIPPLNWGHQCDHNGLFVGWSHLHRFINWNTFFSSKTHTMGPTFMCPIQSLKWGHQREHTRLNLGLGGKIQKVHHQVVSTLLHETI